MDEQRLMEIIALVPGRDEAAMEAARKRQDELAKPPGSLGGLERLSILLAGMTGRVHNRVDKKRLIVLAADNGVVEEGVSATPQSVTLAQTINLTRGLTGAATLAKHFGNELVVVDVGVNAVVGCPAVLDRKIAMGTKNLAKVPAMTRAQAVRAVLTGIELAQDAHDAGVQILGVGEMGIGNTTTSSAVLAALTGASVESVTGKGGGLTDEAFTRKKAVITQALELHRPDGKDPLDVLAKVGGFDIAAMTGVYIGAAASHIPVVVDGFISVVAALTAARLCPNAKDYMLPSHVSYERGYNIAAEELALEPFLLLGMRLGEGSGCPLAFEVVSAACAIINDMATFEEASINDDYLEEIRAKDSFSIT